LETAVRAEFTILYNHGSEQYQFEKTLAPDEQMMVDLGKLIRQQVPDKQGHVLPADLTSGTYLRDLTDTAVGDIYEGKVTVDTTYGHAAYGCGVCCGYEGAYMLYNPLGVQELGFSNQQVQSINKCSGGAQTITGDFPTWWTANTGIATANKNSIHGVAVGSTTHSAQSITLALAGGGIIEGNPCPTGQLETSANTNVSCAVPTNYRQTSGTADNVNGVINFAYAWDSSTGKLADLSSCTVREVVTYPGGNPFVWPSPPFIAGQSTPNPTTPTPLAGQSGQGFDSHGHPDFLKPYKAASFTATQYYQYICPCSNGGQPVNLMGPLYIFRSVTGSGTAWKYTVTKSGVSATETLP
jgi:hypothetical protein